MNLWLNIIIVVILTPFFIFRYIKDKAFYNIIFVIWLLSSLLQHLFVSKPFFIGLGIFQMVLFFIVIFLLFKSKAKRRNSFSNMLDEFDKIGRDNIAPNNKDNDKTEDKEV